jgi:hypothetical protein
VTSIDDRKRATLALSRGRDEQAEEQGAEVIDLVYLPARARPHPRAELDYEEVLEARALNCRSYAECLAFAASVHWRSFSCKRCPRFGETGDAHHLGACPEESDDASFAPVIHLRR